MLALRLMRADLSLGLLDAPISRMSKSVENANVLTGELSEGVNVRLSRSIMRRKGVHLYRHFSMPNVALVAKFFCLDLEVFAERDEGRDSRNHKARQQELC